MVSYEGFPYNTKEGGYAVCKDNRSLNPRQSQKLVNHSPNGFNWGYGGSGPAQLALALLLDATGDVDYSLAHYQDFKWQVVANLPQGQSWVLDQDYILEWMTKQVGTPLRANLEAHK